MGDVCLALCAQDCCCILHGVEACCGACGSLQGIFHAQDGISTAMQLFSVQTAHLRMAVHESSVYQAQLCGFFSLLGAMPQCLKAETDAIMLMIRRARETSEHTAAEAQPSNGDIIPSSHRRIHLEHSMICALLLCQVLISTICVCRA